MRLIFILILLPLMIYAKVDLVTVSPGMWRVVPDGKDKGSALYFNKVATDGYFSIRDFKAFVSLPFSYTHERENGNYQVGLGDIQWYVGWQFGLFQPRLGMVIPGVYSVKDSWIGSQDLRIGIGLAITPHMFKDEGMHFSFEIGWFPYISKSFGLAEAGSWDLTTITKGYYNFSQGTSITGELLWNMNSVEWEWTTPEKEFKMTFVPVISAAHKFTTVFEMGGKIGLGPTLAKIGDGTMGISATNFSLGLFFNFYPQSH